MGKGDIWESSTTLTVVGAVQHRLRLRPANFRKKIIIFASSLVVLGFIAIALQINRVSVAQFDGTVPEDQIR
jgi:hypothetical protein